MFDVTKDSDYHVDGWIAFSAGPGGNAVLSMTFDDDDQRRDFGVKTTFNNVTISTGNAYMIEGHRVVLQLWDHFTNALFCVHELPA